MLVSCLRPSLLSDISPDFVSSGFGNLGGVISGFAYRTADSPRFYSGHGLLIATVSMSFCLCLFMHLYLVRENRRRDAEMTSKGLTLEDYTHEMKAAEREQGDYATVSWCHSQNCRSFQLIIIPFLQFFRYTE